MKRLLLILPLGVLLVFLGLFGWRMHHAQQNPALPSLAQRAIPAFAALPLSPEHPGFASTDLHGQYILVNFFASWCAPCLIEHPVLMDLSSNVPVYGIAFADRVENVQKMLQDKGNPFARVNDDSKGLLGVDWGVKGIPETFLVDPQGKIVWSFAGPLTATQRQEILDIVRQ